MKFYENLLKKLRKFKFSTKSSKILNFRLFFGRFTFYDVRDADYVYSEFSIIETHDYRDSRLFI
ncbi:hypothetical protein BpHYR1_044062 [Brachionus plicatilis]|uniref:Uncharacterized protein n=1 Tax=Brachionus plicatilis TaxID=10195 RepID=A0A3M7PW50_BRAPC|nr:hypothetical protein BpHYR1_044062 [Brachionus plicatilis]